MHTFDELAKIDKLEDRLPKIGMKAESLVRLRAGGFNVPDGFVVCVGEDAAKTGEIEKFAEAGICYAVRSSGTSEDLAGASFAGQYDSYLNVQGFAALRRAIRDCQNSIDNDRVKAYAKKNGIDLGKSGVAVIVQKMVQAEKAGVAFSVDVINGLDREILIEAVIGLGDRLVGGQVSPDYYSYNWYDETFTAYGGGVLTREEVRELAKTVLEIQQFYGYPVDVEWAITGGEIFVLQSRPVTNVGYMAIPDEWTTADFRDGGISASACKALMASLYGLVFSDSFLGSAKAIGLLEKSYGKSAYGTYFGRPYWNLSVEKHCFSKLPGFVEREIDEDMGVVPAYEGDGIVTGMSFKTICKALFVLAAISGHTKKAQKTAETKKADLLCRFLPFERLELSGKSGDELQAIWVDFVKHQYCQSESTYFGFIFCCMVLSSLFKGEIKGHLPSGEAVELYAGLSDVSHMRPIYDAWELSRGGYTDADLALFVEKYRHHSQHELDISFPNWDETPEIARAIIEGFAKTEEGKNPKLLCESQRRKYLAALAKVPRRLHKKIARLRSFLWWREEFRDISTRSYHIIRKLTLALGKAWEEEGILDSADDIFHLSAGDIEKMANRANLKEISAKNRKYYNSFLRYCPPGEIGGAHSHSSGGKRGGGALLKGVPCSGETLTATARVIQNIHDSIRLQPGDILVTKCTDPAWTAVFGRIGGVITETGGILSHAAVVSREYGISCIVAAKNATDAIKEGDIVTMDCKTGEIYIHTDRGQNNDPKL